MNERPSNLPALSAGGIVTAIVPQSVEEIWRVSTMIVEAGLAPISLVGKEPGQEVATDEYQRWGKKATSAVAAVIMSGAELGLPPMVSLRSFTVIGGKPALYGDGLINVVRRHRKAAFVRTGCDLVGGELIGWCEAKRSDTHEMKREEFSRTDAQRAGLWDERPTRRGRVWKNNQQVWDDVPNDSTWFRYPKRMLAWRAAGYCLRELFADVLGGITDEFEAREIAGGWEEDPAPAAALPKPPSPNVAQPPSPPKVPSPPSAKGEAGSPSDRTVDRTDPFSAKGIDQDLDAGDAGDALDYGDYFERLDHALRSASTEADVEEVWTDFDPEARFEDDPDSRELADGMKSRRLALLHPINAG